MKRKYYKIFCVNGKYGIQNEFRIFYFLLFSNEENYEGKESSNADEVLSKEFLSQFKIEADVRNYMHRYRNKCLREKWGDNRDDQTIFF